MDFRFEADIIRAYRTHRCQWTFAQRVNRYMVYMILFGLGRAEVEYIDRESFRHRRRFSCPESQTICLVVVIPMYHLSGDGPIAVVIGPPPMDPCPLSRPVAINPAVDYAVVQ